MSLSQFLSQRHRYLVFAAAALFIGGCSSPASEVQSWQIVWQDEFQGPEGQSPDSTKWTYDIGTDWGNQQLEYDTDRPENVSLDGLGNLAFTAREETWEGQPYTSARVVTRGLFERAYGRYEARIKLPAGQGIWPAFWLLGADIRTVGWPECGEIDIMEYLGHEPSILHGTVHGPGYAGDHAITTKYELEGERFDSAFHVFAVEWGEDRIDWFIDGEKYHTVTPNDVTGRWAYDHPFYIILNVAVGGSFAGPPDSTTVFPQQMLVDWVRVHERTS